ncbi:MAG: hypothetical protein EOP49_51670, partial [Sphingobacteriales bacterium]
MKTKFIGLLLLSLSIFSSCNKNDDDSPANADVRTVATTGNWRVTYFFDDNRDQTAFFSGYTFTFGSNNTVTAAKGSTTLAGTWATDTDDSKS